MAQIQIPNGRLHSDIRAHVALKDNGVAVDWNGLSDIRARMYSVPQEAMAGEFSVAINAEDGTDLICDYSAETPQYEGLCRIVVRCVYEGRTKTYDAALINLVPSTDNLADEPIVMDDPEVDVEIEVTEVSTSLLDEAIETAFDAAERAENAAELAEEKAEAADLAAVAAIQAAENADTKAALAAEKAQAAEDAAALADAKALAAEAAAHQAAEKAIEADGAADHANDKAQQAQQAAQQAQQAAGDATDAAAAAGAAAGEAQAQAAAAQGATERANAAAGEATTQAGYAKDQGDYAKEQIDGAKGDFGSLDERLDHNDQISIYIDETTDPTDEEYRDEYLRVLEVLYQAIVDAKTAIAMTGAARNDAITAAQKALNAAMEAVRSADYADRQAQYAREAGERVLHEMDDAKGDFDTLGERLENIEEGKQDVIEDLAAIRTGAGKGATAYQKPEDGIPGSDLDEDAQAGLAKAGSAVQPSDLAPVALTGSYTDLTERPKRLSQFTNNVAVTFEENNDPGSLFD